MDVCLFSQARCDMILLQHWDFMYLSVSCVI